MQDLTIDRTFYTVRGPRTRKLLCAVPPEPAPMPPAARTPRIARLRALAIRLDHLVRTGVVANQAELALLGHVSRTRITQIMNLVLLAPDVQEAILFLTEEDCGPEGLYLRDVQPIAAVPNWRRQRRLWARLGIRKPQREKQNAHA
jgi:hypothetical protein